MPTYPLLERYDDNLVITEIASNPGLIREIQELLKLGGFYSGPTDGKFNADTSDAFKRFKQKAYLEYPSVLGISTAKELLEIAEIGKHPMPTEAAAVPSPLSQGKSMRLPGGETVYCGQLIQGSKHFYWGEATKNGAREPLTREIVRRIIDTAALLDSARSYLGDRQIAITSWYRPPKVNRDCGGVPNSRHLIGDGVDILVEGIAPLEVYKLLSPWLGARGGLGKSSRFTHIDLRGYQARWLYGS